MNLPKEPIENHWPRINAMYDASGDAGIRVYSGDLQLSSGEDTWTAVGDIVLRLDAGFPLFARFGGEQPWIADHAFRAKDPVVSIPESAVLRMPPIDSAVPEAPTSTSSWLEYEIPMNELEAGKPDRINRMILHVNGRLANLPLPQRMTADGGSQGALRFRLPDWDLTLAEVGSQTDEHSFSFVVEATLRSDTCDRESVKLLTRRIFMLLRFIASGGITVGASVGFDSDNAVVWAAWGAGRMEKSGPRWCPRRVINTALPEIAQGIIALAEDPGLEACVERSISLLLSVNEPGVLDTKVPNACSGLELLAWAVIQRKTWMTTDTMRRLTSPARLRFLLHWAGLPVELPPAYTALQSRHKRKNQADLAGPELVFDVRNALVHPPKDTTDPEWPSRGELLETWHLATWYLEASILRILGYEGEYVSRLNLNRWEGETDPLPWVDPAASLAVAQSL
ncbi:hypothetical protein AB0I34_09175 [Kribbella sp. NPDC050281]|uniref:hypothetical protein n=1 Tax=Kribbella sp. NPDC050281 TaxID=3155515 RepID=UPI0033D70E81